MAYPTLNEFDMSQGLGQLFVAAAATWVGFIPMFLFAIFMIVTLGTFFGELRLFGRKDFPGSFAVGAFVTFVIALMLRLQSGLVNTETMAILLVIASMSLLWLVLGGERGTL